MARIPESEIERLKNEVSVERLVEASGIELKKAGKDWLGCCPFHADDTASLVVTPAKNLWHCFGCGVGGGPIDWIIKKNGVSFRHAVELLREGLPSSSLAADSGSVKRSTVRALPPPVAFDADDQALLNQTVDYYHERLLAAPEAQAYLLARGLNHPELVAHFKLGLADRTLGLRLPEKTRRAGADIRARPAPWLNQDIGAPGLAGSANESGGTYTIQASGSDIWDVADSFNYTYQTLNGDGQIIARVVSVQNTSSWAKAGIMIRQDLSASSANANLMVTATNGSAFQARLSAGAIASDTVAGTAAVWAPYWLKLTRTGNTSAAISRRTASPGRNWAATP